MKNNKPVDEKPKEFVENTDYYFENGLMVLTSQFLKKRGYCCDNHCRHCPYSQNKSEGTTKEMFRVRMNPE